MRISIALAVFAVLVSTFGAQAASISILNSGFESANLALVGNGTYSQLIVGSTITQTGGTLDNWTASSTSLFAAAGGFDPSMGNPNWTSKWWSGNNIAYLQSTDIGTTISLSQALSSTLQDNTIYTLSALIGRRIFGTSFNYSLQLFAGNTLLASASSLSLANDSFGSDSAIYTSGANDPNAGQILKIVLSQHFVGTFGTTEAFFDNVALDARSTNVPEPSTLALTALAFIATGLLPMFRRSGRI